MFHLKDMKVSTRLRSLVAAVILGLSVTAVVSYLTIEKVRVGGPIYSEMALYHDLNGEVTPAALEIEQVRYVVLLMLVDNSNKERLPRDIALFQERKKAYIDANEKWKRSLPDGKLKELICVQSYQTALQYFDVIEREIIPALSRGNWREAESARERAAALVAKVSEFTNQADQLIDAQEADLDRNATRSAETSMIVMAALAILVGLVIVVLGLTIGRGVSNGTDTAVRVAKAMAAGDLKRFESDLGQNEFGDLLRAMNQSIDAVHALIADTKVLSQAAVEGKLSTRADAGRHQGDYRALVRGVNATLDAVIGPLNVAADYIDKIGKGNVPPKITDTYGGDFNLIKNNLNACIDNVNALVADTSMLAQAAVEGRLSTRADAAKHGGDFRKIVERRQPHPRCRHRPA